MILIGEEVIDVPSVEELHGTVLSHAEDLRNHDRVISDLEERVDRLIRRTEENGQRQQTILSDLTELRSQSSRIAAENSIMQRHIDETRQNMQRTLDLINSHISIESNQMIEWAEKHAETATKVGDLYHTVGKQHAEHMDATAKLHNYLGKLVLLGMVGVSLLGALVKEFDVVAVLSQILGIGG